MSQQPISTAKLLDFHLLEEGQRRVYTFRITAKDNDFQQALIALKTAVPSTQRSFDSETKFWRVQATEANEQVLRDIFVNAEQCLTLVKSQLRLF